MKLKSKNGVLYVGTFPPRECGIATFTNDLIDAMDKRFNPLLSSEVLAINDDDNLAYGYSSKVSLQMDENKIKNYIECAKKINKRTDIKIVNIQHEFGIFGGQHGEYLLLFLNELKKPVVITMHTVTPNPDEDKRLVTQSLIKKSSAVIVMANDAKRILREDYDISDEDKIYFIHHGVPQIKFGSMEAKSSLDLGSRKILSTFGLINSGKGIEYVIKALPEIAKKYPDMLYLIIGETHPRVKKQEGEIYRNSLIKLVKGLNLENNVKFYNKYLTLEELTNYLSATDIYIAPALDENQIVSGSLSYALGCGKAIVSTPTLYAREVLAGNRGLLVNFKDPDSIRQSVLSILSNKRLKDQLEKKAYKLGRRMIWPNVASDYLRVFNKVDKLRDNMIKKFPIIKLDHLNFLTDNVGIIHHAKHSIPNRKTGYTLDDNARAMIVAVKHFDLFKSKQSLKLINTYLSFIHYVQKKEGKFHNFLNYGKRFLDHDGSEDSNGRALMACGHLISSNLGDNVKHTAKFVFDNAAGQTMGMKFLRSKAFSIAGLQKYHLVYKHKDIIDKINTLANSLVESYKTNSSKDWRWFEPQLTYSNGILPEALFLAYTATGNEEQLQIGKESLDFLSSVLIKEDKLILVGNRGWYRKGENRALFDQQPVDAASMVSSYLAAFRVTKDPGYYDRATLAFNWFLGKNSINQMVYDEITGGCFDGLSHDAINLNQGAESTISYLLARLNMEEANIKF
jgi:glycosyltransferase involved in cell wall biosynthesis